MFSSSEQFDMGSSRGEHYDVDKRNDFSLKISTAFVLTFLALAVAVCVGLIVHFAGGNKNVTCLCNCGAASDSDNQVGCPDHSTSTPLTCPPCQNVTYTTATPTSTAPPDSSPPITSDVLLPSALKPIHYNVVLRPNLYEPKPSDFSLYGRVKIYVNCSESTDNITLHIQNLNITEGTLKIMDLSSAETLAVQDHVIDNSARHFLIITMKENLKANTEYSIEMNFTGPLQNVDLTGLYYSTYMENDQERYMAITQFQPTDARKAFPSFDEPGLKATFNITLERHHEMITLSNMPSINTVNSTDGYVADVFDQTVIMPTYLLAFAVCDFVYKENITKYNHTFRTYARREYIEHTNYSLWVGSRLLDEFEDYFEIEYPLPKLDMIAIPDFSAGAMENWGLVTYRETLMFYHPDISTVSQHIFTALIVAHELAHMWFGNFISPKWWDDLWLNEGFATFFEYVGVDLVETDWDMMNYIALDCVQYSFDTDSLNSSRPIYQEVWTPSQINSIFDVITYFKGASVIRMMWFFLGKEIFRQGLSNYIRSREYGNVQHDDLWEALSKESAVNGTSVDVKSVMDTWVEQKNYPLINVTRIANGVHLTQQRFLLGEHDSSSQNYIWKIPVTYTTDTEIDFDQDFRNITWMNVKEMDITSVDSGFKWIIVNIHEYGYYRVTYETEVWNAITQQLIDNHAVIHVVNRASLISDAWALNKANLLDIETALHTLDYLDNEEEYIPWGSAIKEFTFLDRMLISRTAYGHFVRFMIAKVNATFMNNQLDIMTNQSVQKILLQSRIASRACKYGIAECVDKANEIFLAWKADPDNFIIAPDIKLTVLCTALRHSTPDEWEFVFSKYANASANDQSIYIEALSCTNEYWVLNRYLEYSIDTDRIRSQSARAVILAVASNPAGLHLAWRFVRSNWIYLVKESAVGGYALNQIVLGLSRRLFTDYDLSQVEAWKKAHPSDASYLSGFDEAIETVKTNMAWQNNNYKNLENWLNNKYMQSY